MAGARLWVVGGDREQKGWERWEGGVRAAEGAGKGGKRGAVEPARARQAPSPSHGQTNPSPSHGQTIGKPAVAHPKTVNRTTSAFGKQQRVCGQPATGQRQY